jgi:hypothetical protein
MMARDGEHEFVSLASAHRSWGPPSDAETRWLLQQGLDEQALCRPWPIGGAAVQFDGHTFTTEPAGTRALTFRATDRDDVIDLIAWQPRTDQLASWRGVAFCLGDIDAALNPATYFAGGVLRIHRTPLDWLKAGRDGLVILKPKLCWAYLRNVPRLAFADISLARQLKAWLLPPEPQTEILIERSIKEKAA